MKEILLSLKRMNSNESTINRFLVNGYKKREYENVSPLNFISRVSFCCDDYDFFVFYCLL